MIRRIIQLTILMVVLLTTSGAWATTYYIDWVGGDDANNGISQSTPWKRAPGMHGCASNCAAYQTAHNSPTNTTGAGNKFVFKGGVTWPNAALSWGWYYGSGTQSGPIEFTIDQTWHTGTSWSRPIINGEGIPLTADANGATRLFRAYGDWLIIDNIEFTGYAQLTGEKGGTLQPIVSIGASTPSGGEVKNCYFHGWSHGGTAVGDNVIVLTSASISGSPDMGLKIHHNVWDGSDTTGDMAQAYMGSAGHFYNNYISKMSNGIVSTNQRYIWGNTFKDIGKSTANKSCPGYPNGFFSFDCTQHGNSIESQAAQSIIYNNLLQNVGGGVILWTQPKLNYVDYVFNNVILDGTSIGLQISDQSLTAGNIAGYYVFNNTIHKAISVTGPSSGGAGISFGIIQNNHLIGDTAGLSFGHTLTTTANNNITMSNAVATSAGYVSSSTYPFWSPTGGVTVGAGMDLRSLAQGIPSTTISDAATAALSGTSCGVKYDAVNHRVIGPNITPMLRGTKWDVGAYRSGAPPQNLRITASN